MHHHRLALQIPGLFDTLKEEVGDTLGWHTVDSLRLASSKDRLKSLQGHIFSKTGAFI